MHYYLSLGSNIGRTRQNLERARLLLEENGVRILRQSSLYRTQPVGYAGQPWFINQVLGVECRLEPVEVLALVKKLEGDMKRLPGRRFGPRLIDIDILLAGRRVMARKRLHVPHPELPRRKFVLTALAEIAPRAVHPALKKSVRRLLSETQDRSSVIRLSGG